MADSIKLRLYDVKQDYQLIEKVGCGTYGTVFKAHNRKTGEYVAFKKIQNKDVKLQADGFPITALREIQLLKRMHHPNIVKLKEVIVSKPSKKNLFRGSTFLVFEYVEHDFAGLFKNRIHFPLHQIKCFMHQLLEGVAYLHKERILHRDLKSANLLLSAEGMLKIADFGLGRKFRPDFRYTSKVVTLWYRAPELLMGAREYSSKVDMWSVGCIFAEFFIHDVLFKKDREYDQIERIYDVCGGIQENNFFDPSMSDEDRVKVYSGYKRQMHPRPISIIENLKKYNSTMDESTMNFISQFLQLNPHKRISAQDALNHPYFKESPLPCDPKDIPQLNTEYHDMVSRKIVEKPSYKSSQYKYPLPKPFEQEKAPYREHNKGYVKQYSREHKQYSGKDKQYSGKDKDYLRDYVKDYGKDYSRQSKQYRPNDHQKYPKREEKDDYRKRQQSRDYDRKRQYHDSREKDKQYYTKDKYYKDSEKHYREKQRSRERSYEKQKERERQRQREKERERERQREREKDLDRQRDRNRDNQRYESRINQKHRQRMPSRQYNSNYQKTQKDERYPRDERKINYEKNISSYKDTKKQEKEQGLIDPSKQSESQQGEIKSRKDDRESSSKYYKDEKFNNDPPREKGYKHYRERSHSKQFGKYDKKYEIKYQKRVERGYKHSRERQHTARRYSKERSRSYEKESHHRERENRYNNTYNNRDKYR